MSVLSRIKDIITPPPPSSTYEESCRAACCTPDGAKALAADLLRQAEARPLPFNRKRILRQHEAAKQAARHVQLRVEISDQIPHALDSAAARAIATIKASVATAKVAQKSYDNAVDRVNALTEEKAALTRASKDVDSAANQLLEQAESSLENAKATADLNGVERAAGEVVEAKIQQAAAQSANAKRCLQIDAVGEMLSKAHADLGQAKADLTAAALAQAASEVALKEVEADRSSLAALVAHIAWRKAAAELPRDGSVSGLPAEANRISFLFLNSEHAPLTNGRAGAVVLDTWALKAILDAAAEPSWRFFAVDPTQETEHEQSDLGEIASQADVEIDSFNPDAGYPRGNPHFDRATGRRVAT